MEDVAGNLQGDTALKEFMAEEEFLRLVREMKKKVRIGMFGEGKAEEFFRLKLEVYEE
ncbi:hypothetical protein [Thermococcus sp.]|uniref:hypothetical protein n=1 Tax=Thermococcus sp. TaxID=35749 RepID=UPI0026053A66|nr:hypothetical protein [Thermococcus sp.]